MQDFSTKVAIVTGGANGMGEATARLLAQRGATVVIADKDAERSALVAGEIAAAGGAVAAIPTDIREVDQVEALFAQVRERWGRVDVLDNNAAGLDLTAEDPDVLGLTPGLLMETLQANVLGAFLMTRAALPLMLERGSGAIVNIASVSGMAGELSLTAYGISKAALIQLTRATAIQYGDRGIRCNAVAPAYVRTSNNEEYAPPELDGIYARAMATPETAEPADIAAVVAFLASDAARMVTGHVVPVDGGVAASSPIVADFRDWRRGALQR